MLSDPEPGDSISLGKKISDMFTLDDVPEGNNLILVGTGTGLAPYMSMLRSELECHLDLHTVVLPGARNSWDLGYRGELIAMQRYCPTFHYIPVISRPEEEMVKWSGQTGYVQDLWDRGFDSPDNRNVGHPQMHNAICLKSPVALSERMKETCYSNAKPA